MGTTALLFTESTSKPAIAVTDFSATPNPAPSGAAVTFSVAGSISGDENGTGSVDFGDGTTSESTAVSGKVALTLQHTYAADGAYAAVLTLQTPSASQQAKVYVVVGKGTAVNPVDGMIVHGSVDDTGTVTLSLIIDKIPDATDASTTFDDSLNREDPVLGLWPSRSYTMEGISVATSRATDANGNEKAKVRKTLPIGGKAVGESGALPAPRSSDIKVTKLSGAFIFSKAKPDKVDFSGELPLPAGFDPKRPGGNTLHLAIGNVSDWVSLDEKGKASAPGTRGRITKAKITFPKITGTATGAEKPAKISATISTTDLVGLGFDTEGISRTRRADEANLKSLTRSVQIAIVLNGVPYEILAPVRFKFGSKDETGKIASRKQ